MINFKMVLFPKNCGHYCLRYIFKKYKVKNKLIYTKKMMSILNIENILLNNGFIINTYKCSRIDRLRHNHHYLSLKKQNKSLHYIIILNYDYKYVYYYDPLYFFKRKKKIKSFLNNWTGIIVDFHFLFNNL